VIFAVMVSAAATALSLGAAALLSYLHGGAINTLTPLLTTAARGLLVAVILAVVGYCAGLVTRHTAAALGLLLGYVFVWFVRNGILREMSAGRSDLPPGAPKATSPPSWATGIGTRSPRSG
jgi:uncharacterized membrane protein HdeD (DUF308 family)